MSKVDIKNEKASRSLEAWKKGSGDGFSRPLGSEMFLGV